MNAHTLPALIDKLKAAARSAVLPAQIVRITSTTHGGLLGPRHVVLVTPAGSSATEQYEVSKHVLAALQKGITPEELELEPHVEEDDEAFMRASEAHQRELRSMSTYPSDGRA